jgi:phospholipase C
MSCRFVLAATLFAASAGGFTSTCSAAQLGDIEHIIVIYLENRSFDNLFGLFPNADGIATAGATKMQVDRNGKPYDFLPRAMEMVDLPLPKEKVDLPIDLARAIKKFDKRLSVDPRFPDNLPNQPFSIEAYVPLGDKTGDPGHRFYHQQAQIDGGLMDKFVAYSNMGALVMGFYDGSQTELWKYAQHYTLADHFFHAAFGGSFLNHFWMICACTPRYEDAPDALKAGSDISGPLRGLPDQVTPDGYAVNTLQPPNPPHKENDPTLPLQDMRTIGDELTDKGVKWAWYAGGWDDAVRGTPDDKFQYHHQPFSYFSKYAPGTPGRDHLKDAQELLDALERKTGPEGKGELPAVVFYKPIGELNEHPGYANVLEGDKHLGRVLHLIEQSPIWSKSIVIVTFDENGGYWDHVPPPRIDRWGPGVRVPTVIISPYAKKGFIDHTTYDSTAILKLIEVRFGLECLGDRDKKSKDLTNAFDFDGPAPKPVCK